MFRAILTYFAVKKIVTFVVLAAMPKADTNENPHVTAMLTDNNRNTREYTHFDSREWENLRTLDVLGA